jgi:tetratricopeptide (TPR) repeat protein
MYFCTTDNCAIALSKATFPVAMNCPVCQTPLQLAQSESVLSEEEQRLIGTLPYVIAYPLKRALDEKHAWTKINLLKDTFLNYLKYLGLLTASEFFNSDLKNRRMVDAFQKNLAQPSFGSWNAFIRECIAFLKEQNHVFFYPELVAYYVTIETGSKRKLYKGEIEYIDSNGDAQLKKQETTAIGLLINFRNRYLGHGLTLDEQASQQLWDEYFPVFKLLLEQMSFSKEYPMLKREHGETYILQGTELKEINSTNTFDGSIWIENQQGEAFEILPFYIVPGALALAKEDKEQVLSYESYTGKTIKFFSPEGSEKQTSGVILEKLNLLLRNKQKETAYSPETFTKEVFLTRTEEENKLVLDTLIQEKKVIEGIYQHRETIEIKLREWIGARANIFFIAAEAGSGKTNLLVEIQKQYTERQLPSLFIRAARMEKSSLKEQIAYQLNLDSTIDLKVYKSIAGTQAEPTFILIDGLNEASNAEAIWAEILEISTLFEPGSLKFVLTNRANSKADLERYELLDEQEQFIYSESKENNREQGLAAHVFWLTPLDMKEMEGAWDAFVKKDKARFKPSFSFNDLATFDRGLYLQINNPLILRIFLETYQGKNLPNESKHLHIWKDWFATFTEQEQLFMRLLVDAIWVKGENEIELEELLNNEQLKGFILTDNISGPYHRLLNLGWISRFHKDLTLYVSFTVEGLLLYLLGVKLDKQESEITIEDINKLLINGTKLKQAAVESYLKELAGKGELDIVTTLIDEGNDKLNFCINPLLIFLKSYGEKTTIEKLLINPTENDWQALFELDEKLEELQLNSVRKEFLNELMSFNPLNTKQSILLGLETTDVLDKDTAIDYLNKIKVSSFQDNEEILFQLSRIENKFGNYDNALMFCQKSLVIRLNLLGEDHPDLAELYYYLGEIYHFKGDFEKVLDFYNKSLDISLKTIGEENRLVADLYDNIGSFYFVNGKYDKSLEFYNKAIDIRIKIFGKIHPDVALSFNNIGTRWHEKGDFDKAQDFYHKSLSIYSKTVGEDNPHIANSYKNIGLIWGDNGDFEKSLDYYNKSLSIYLKTVGEDHPDTADLYNKIGSVWHDIGVYDKSLNFYQKSLGIYLKVVGEEHPSIAVSYNNIGSIWYDKGDYDRALDNYQKSLEIELKNFGDEHPSISTTYSNIGDAYDEKGESDNALAYYTKSLDITLKKYGEEHPFTAHSYNNIGYIYGVKHDYKSGVEFYQKALTIRIKNLGENHSEVAFTYTNIAHLSYYNEDYLISLHNYQEALNIQLNNLDSKHPDIANTYFNIGNTFHILNKYLEAIENFKKGFEISKKGGFSFKIAECYEALNDKENALDYYIQSAEIRKDDPEVGLEAEATQEAISNAIRLAKELGKEGELPEWMKNSN